MLAINQLSETFEYEMLTTKNPLLRRSVYKLWYKIYCEEMGRNLDYADHINKMVTDKLEPHSRIIVAKYREQIVGTIRLSFPGDGNLSYYHNLYQLKNFAANEICIGTRFMVDPLYRGNKVARYLMEDAIIYLNFLNKKYFLIDCSPAVYKLFEKFGFIDYLGEKHSQEYGKVRIMKYALV